MAYMYETPEKPHLQPNAHDQHKEPLTCIGLNLT